MFNRDESKREITDLTDLKLMTFVSAALTIPILYYSRDIAHSLRTIANQKFLKSRANKRRTFGKG